MPSNWRCVMMFHFIFLSYDDPREIHRMFAIKNADRFLGDRLLSMASSLSASSGGTALASRAMSLALNFFPYSLSFAPSSGRNVEPSRNAPAKRPRDLE